MHVYADWDVRHTGNNGKVQQPKQHRCWIIQTYSVLY